MFHHVQRLFPQHSEQKLKSHMNMRGEPVRDGLRVDAKTPTTKVEGTGLTGKSPHQLEAPWIVHGYF